MNKVLLTNVTAFTPRCLPQATIWIENGKIRRVFSGPIPPQLQQIPQLDGKGAYALAGLIDLHIHGFGGFGPETGEPDDLLRMSEALFAQGVSAFCPTLYSAPTEKMKKLLQKLTPAIGREKGAKIIGFHLEGPFISPLKKGVMRPQDILSPDVEILKQFYAAADGKITSVTLAPELPNIKPVIDFCREQGILLQAGHTDATYAQMQQAKAWGVKHATHFGNAMRAFHHREAGAIGCVLMDNDFSCEVIADGFHVSPEVVRFLGRVKPDGQLVLVTDALRPTGQKTGPFYANNEEVILENGVWKRKADGVIAGSALTLLQAIKNLVMWGFPAEKAVAAATLNPARLAGLKTDGQLAEGFCTPVLLTDSQFNLQQLIY